MVSRILVTRLGAIPHEGSSSISSLGLAISPRPIASICCSPPLSVPASCKRLSFNTGKSVKTRSIETSRSAGFRRVYAPSRRFFSTESLGNRRRPSGTRVRRRVSSDIPRLEGDAPCRGHLKTGQRAQSGGFSAPIATEQGDDLAGANREADVLHRGDLAVSDCQALDREHQASPR